MTQEKGRRGARIEEHVERRGEEESGETDGQSIESKAERKDGVPEESATRRGDKERGKGSREETQQKEG